MSAFRKEIENIINRGSKENDSNTPDFILANYLCNCLDAFTLATKNRDKWYSVHLEPCNSHFLNPPKSEEVEQSTDTQQLNNVIALAYQFKELCEGATRQGVMDS